MSGGNLSLSWYCTLPQWHEPGYALSEDIVFKYHCGVKTDRSQWTLNMAREARLKSKRVEGISYIESGRRKRVCRLLNLVNITNEGSRQQYASHIKQSLYKPLKR
jgi:hypothetical protein